MSKLDDVITKLNKSVGVDIIRKGTKHTNYKKIPFTSPKLNHMTFGGIVRGKILEIFGAESGGKAQPLDSLVYTPEGPIKMGDVYVGQTVIGGDGKPTKITGVYPQGVRDIYEIFLDDNTSFKVSDEHLNSVWVYDEDAETDIPVVVTTLELIEIFNSLQLHEFPYITMPIVDCWEYHEVDCPYDYGKSLATNHGEGISKEYLFNSISVRTFVLRGLLSDTSLPGFLVTENSDFSNDLIFLAQSLGIKDVVQNNAGVYIHRLDLFGSVYYNLHTPESCIRSDRNVIKITKVKPQECQCIMVESDCHTYLTDNLTLTHNTTLALDLCGNAQKIFKEEYEKTWEAYQAQYKELITGGKSKERAAAKLLLEINEFESVGYKRVVFVDLENTLDEVWARTLGVDTADLILVRPENQSAEQVLQMILDLIDSEGVGLVVLDSIPMLVPQQIHDESLEKKSMGGVAKLLGDFCIKLVPKLTTKGCTFIGLNQVREAVGSYTGGEITPGGRSWRHNCSMRLAVRKGSFLDAKYAEVSNQFGNPQGNIINVNIRKSKVCKSTRKSGLCTLNYFTGINKAYDLVQLALEYKYILQGGSWFSIIDPNTGEVLTNEDGTAMKYQGLPKLLEALNNNQELLSELDDMLRSEYMEGEEDDE